MLRHIKETITVAAVTTCAGVVIGGMMGCCASECAEGVAEGAWISAVAGVCLKMAHELCQYVRRCQQRAPALQPDNPVPQVLHNPLQPFYHYGAVLPVAQPVLGVPEDRIINAVVVGL